MDNELLEQFLQNGESQFVEFKIAPPRQHELASRLCGMANSATGGYLVLGVENSSWRVVGLANPSGVIDEVLVAARSCKPPLYFDPSLPQIVSSQGVQLVVATVPPNNGTLYQAGGVFWVRRGSHTVPLELSEIENRLYQQGRISWETQAVSKATLEDLNLAEIKLYLEGRPDRRLVAGRFNNMEQILVNLGLAVPSEPSKADQAERFRPTRAGMLLFGYAPQQFLWQAEVVCTLYASGDSLGLRRYSDRRILHGPLPQQIEQAEAFFKQYMPVAGVVNGFHRQDLPDFPLEALREAVVNALVHRDYALEGERIRVLFYTGDRIEVHSPGLLLPGIELAALQQGRVRSKSRNPVIAGVLRDLPAGYMEQAGSGISLMINQMRELNLPAPTFEERDEFIVSFLRHEIEAGATDRDIGPGPKISAEGVSSSQPRAYLWGANLDPASKPNPQSSSSRSQSDPPTNDPSSQERTAAFSTTPSTTPASHNLLPTPPSYSLAERQEIGLEYIKRYHSITNKRYRELTNVSKATAFRDLDQLVKQGVLKEVGDKRSRRYEFL